MNDNETVDRAGQRQLYAWLATIIVVGIVAITFMLLYFKQGQLLGEVVKAVLYVSAGAFGARFLPRRR